MQLQGAVNMTVSPTSISGEKMFCYEQHSIQLRLQDSQGVTQLVKQLFYAIDLTDPLMILGYPWLEEANPHVDWKTKQWWYNADTASIQISHDPDKFLDAAPDVMVYSIYLRHHSEESLPLQYINGGSTPELPTQYEIPRELRGFQDVFSEEEVVKLPLSGKYDHAINLNGQEPPYELLYNLSERELDALQTYLDDTVKKGWIHWSTSSAGAPILFIPKKDGGLRLCVDYRGLNQVTIKNRHPLPLITETLDCMVRAKSFVKLDLKDAYHQIWIKEGDEWKTAFRTQYGHFEYLVMLFGLANTPVTF